VRAVFGKRALVQRCQEHKKRNVLDALPQNKRVSVKRVLNAAFHTDEHARAKRMLENLARSLKEQHPGAAASLREGLEDLLTVKQLGLGGSRLERTVSTTNLIKNLIGQVRHLSGRVKRWRSGKMILRWSAAGVLEAELGFRRVRGYQEMPELIAALQKHAATRRLRRGMRKWVDLLLPPERLPNDSVIDTDPPAPLALPLRQPSPAPLAFR